MYYKIEQNGTIIGIAASDDLYRCGLSGNILTANEHTAQFIKCGSKSYHADWMQEVTAPGTVEQAEVSEISEDEYNSYLEAIEAGEEILQTISEEEAVEEYISEDADTDVGNSENETSQTMPTYEDLLKAFIALKISNDATVSALEDMNTRVAALEGVSE